MPTFDENGNDLSGLPDGAIRVESSLSMLSGKYVDGDGIIYDADGTVNEPATAAYAREVAAGRIAARYNAPSVEQIKQQSIREQADAEATRAYIDAQFSNIWTTFEEIPGRIADVAQTTASGINTAAKWLIAGLIAVAVLEVIGTGRQISGRVRKTRKRAARYVRERSNRAADYIGG